MKRIIATQTGESLECEYQGEWNIEDLYTALLSIIRSQTEQLVTEATKSLKEEEVQALKEGIYDRLNYAFARILDDILPPADDLTTEAILRAENELIAEKYDELSDKEKAAPVDREKFIQNIDED